MPVALLVVMVVGGRSLHLGMAARFVVVGSPPWYHLAEHRRPPPPAAVRSCDAISEQTVGGGGRCQQLVETLAYRVVWG
jgi:hypothetical protein